MVSNTYNINVIHILCLVVTNVTNKFRLTHNYNALKKLGQTGDSFNSVIGKLIEQSKEEVTK